MREGCSDAIEGGIKGCMAEKKKRGQRKRKGRGKNKEEKMDGGKDAERFLPFSFSSIFISFLLHLSVALSLFLFEGIKGGKEAGME